MIIYKFLVLVPIFFFANCLLGNSPSDVQAKKSNFPGKDEILKKFDTDGDGKLNEEERKKVRDEMASRRSGLPPLLAQKFDKDRDGKLSDQERAEFRKEMVNKGRKLSPHLMQRFDKNGDGVLSEEERSDARKAWEDRKKSMLEKFDTDGDGTLNVKERREAIKQARLDREANIKAELTPKDSGGEKTPKSGNSERSKPGKGAKKKDKKKEG